MARSDAFSNRVESPVKKYLSWSSNDKCFTYYDREAKMDVKVKLPLTIVYFDSFSSIKGFSDKHQSSIYSNEVKSTKTEPLYVRAFKGGELVSGIYKDIKGKIEAEGGHYNASIYAMLNGEIVNIAMKGSVVQHWSEFTKLHFKKFLTNEIILEKALDMKKGSIKYTVPEFVLGKEISDADGQLGDKLYDELQAYFKARKEAPQQEEIVQAEEPSLLPKLGDAPVFETVEDNPLPF